MPTSARAVLRRALEDADGLTLPAGEILNAARVACAFGVVTITQVGTTTQGTPLYLVRPTDAGRAVMAPEAPGDPGEIRALRAALTQQALDLAAMAASAPRRTRVTFVVDGYANETRVAIAAMAGHVLDRSIHQDARRIAEAMTGATLIPEPAR